MNDLSPCQNCTKDKQTGNPYSWQAPCSDCEERREWIFTLIQKSTPKKPKNIEIHNGERTYPRSASCPNCGYDFPDIGGENEACYEVEMFDYCPMCGQRIDWSEVK